MRKFGLIMNLSMNTVLGFIMTTVALLGQHNFTLENLLTAVVVSLGIGYLVSDVVPAIPFSEKVTANIQNPIIKHFVKYHKTIPSYSNNKKQLLSNILDK